MPRPQCAARRANERTTGANYPTAHAQSTFVLSSHSPSFILCLSWCRDLPRAAPASSSHRLFPIVYLWRRPFKVSSSGTDGRRPVYSSFCYPTVALLLLRCCCCDLSTWSQHVPTGLLVQSSYCNCYPWSSVCITVSVWNFCSSQFLLGLSHLRALFQPMLDVY